MAIGRNKLYSLLIFACSAGYVWLYFIIANDIAGNKAMEVCLIKRAADIPCPSCGTSRSVVSIIKGNYLEALLINPLGYIIAAVMIIAPVWILIDIVAKKQHLHYCYKKTEIVLSRPKFAIPLVLLILTNWIWNILKGL
jgi:hypothetical protein